MSRERFGRTLRQYRHRAGLSQPQLARRIPISQASLSRYESGGQAVDPVVAARLDDLLDAGGVLRALVAESTLDVGESSVAEEDDMRRRALLAGMGAAVLGGAVSALDPVRRQADAVLGGPIGEQDAVEWERAAEEYAHQVGWLPSEQVLPELMVDLDDATRDLDRAPDELRSRLARVCGLFGGLAAISLLSVGSWRDAGRFWRLGERAARISGDRALSTVLAGRRAVFSLYAPTATPDAMFTLIDDALALGDGTASAGTAEALGARAQLLATTGDGSGARAALAELERTFEGLDEITRADPLSVWGWPENRLWHTKSFVDSYLGDRREAVVAQEAALARYTRPGSLGAAQIRLHQAMSMIASGDPSAGARHIVDVLDPLAPTLRCGFVRSSALAAFHLLPERAANLPEVRQARELISLGETL